ncbi:MAG: alpha/beta hydrolase [Sphingomonadaceae bacterium]|nr:alpha/beta hydrolase [Sphingomonadaceae bacterium]
MRRSHLALLLAALLPGCAGASAPTDIAARLPGGRTLNLFCAGRGAPTVILESGWSGDSRGWPRVMPALAARSRVCAYDRAGSGRSSAGPLPRDGAAIARDLDLGLRAAGVAGPFVAVGHSTGALYVRLFADRRPRDVIGMVLVDGDVEHQQRRFEAAFGPGAESFAPLIARSAMCLAAARAGPIPADDKRLSVCAVDPPGAAGERWSARLSELESLSGATSAELDGGRASYGAMPLIALTAGQTFPGPAAQFWSGLHREIAIRSTRGEERIVADSGHLMMVDRPDAIVGAVRDVIAAARQR